jgi:hypothetical protein
MNVRAIVKTALDEIELNEIKLLFIHTPFSAFTQNPEFSQVLGSTALHVVLHDEESSSLIGYSLVTTKNKLIATISSGPICADENLFPILVTHCISALHRYGIKIVRIQPPFIQSSTWQATLQNLQKKLISFTLPAELNWSTLLLDISPSEEILIKTFSENHRRSLKKSQNEELVIEEINDVSGMKGFAEGMCKMYSARELPYNLEVENEKLNKLFHYAHGQKNGFILKVTKGEILLGGIITIKHNNVMFYLVGFSDSEYKKIPVNHSLFLKSFEIAKLSGCTFFDFGGYARLENADEQLLKINRFKDGFRGKRIDHPDTILFAKNQFYKFLYINFVKFFKSK